MLTLLSLAIYAHDISLLLFMSDFFEQCFVVFSVDYISLVLFIPKNFIISDLVLNNVFKVLFFSACC